MSLASARLWIYQAVANYSLGNIDEAERSTDDALDCGGWHLPKAYHVLGPVHAQRNQFELAAQHLKRYLRSGRTHRWWRSSLPMFRLPDNEKWG